MFLCILLTFVCVFDFALGSLQTLIKVVASSFFLEQKVVFY